MGGRSTVVGVDGMGKSEGGRDELGMGNAGPRGASGKVATECWEPNIESVGGGDVCRVLVFGFGFFLLAEGCEEASSSMSSSVSSIMSDV